MYIDGFKTETSTGTGVYNERSRVQLSVSLDHYGTVFQAEVTTIQQDKRNKSIAICLDRRAGLKTISSTEVKFRRVRLPDSFVTVKKT